MLLLKLLTVASVLPAKVGIRWPKHPALSLRESMRPDVKKLSHIGVSLR